MFERIYDRSDYNVAATGIGVVSLNTSGVAPTNLFTASRLAGYQALRDDIRIESVRYTFHPLTKGTCTGRVCAYIEREIGEAVVATVNLAMDQFEKSSGTLSDQLVLVWKPQSPSDRQFNLLTPGTVNLANINIVGDLLSQNGVAVPNTTVIYTLTVETFATLRGRP